MAKQKKQKPLILERQDIIGHPGAEDDRILLSKCFYHSSSYKIMGNIDNPKSILIGGTGAGKTALIEQFHEKNEKNCVRLSLDEVTLNYLSNSNIINVLEENGINLNVLYQTMWRHFLAIQLLRKKLDKTTRGSEVTMLSMLHNYFRSNNYEAKVAEYIEKLDSDFWLEPVDCIKKSSLELVKTLHGSIGQEGVASIEAGISTQHSFDITEKNKIQKAIDATQIQILAKVISFLNDEIFTDTQNPFFVVIDELDTNWVIKKRKYQLIRALIEAIRAFKKIQNVKIIIALRTDLYERIISATKDEGFQLEKYETYLLPVEWEKSELFELINKRINEVFKSRYTNQSVNFYDIAPETIKNKKCFDYLYDRTLKRPRHIIMFINSCINSSVGKNKFTQATVIDAEKEYSNLRYKAVVDEWGESFGFIEQARQMLERIRLSNFEIGSIDKDIINDTASEICDGNSISKFDVSLKVYAEEAFFDDNKTEKFLANLFKMLYQIGIIGIKLRAHETYEWNFTHNQNISASSIAKNTSVKIHPMFWNTLGVNSKEELKNKK